MHILVENPWDFSVSEEQLERFNTESMQVYPNKMRPLLQSTRPASQQRNTQVNAQPVSASGASRVVAVPTRLRFSREQHRAMQPHSDAA